MKPGRWERGWALLEVAASLMLLSIILVVLCQAWISVVGRVSRTEQLLNAVAVHEGSPASAWAWGPALVAAQWVNGPELRATAQTISREEIRAGLWVDGWFVGEQSVQTGEASFLVGDPVLWQGHPGEEVLVRLRAANGGWGPPWRLVVPGTYAGDEDSGTSQVGVHLPLYGTAEVVMTAAGGSLRTSGCGYAGGDVPAGVVEVEVGGVAQEFRATGGRSIDLFF